jgi:hypothetical protein
MEKHAKARSTLIAQGYPALKRWSKNPAGKPRERDWFMAAALKGQGSTPHVSGYDFELLRQSHIRFHLDAGPRPFANSKRNSRPQWIGPAASPTSLVNHLWAHAHWLQFSLAIVKYFVPSRYQVCTSARMRSPSYSGLDSRERSSCIFSMSPVAV